MAILLAGAQQPPESATQTLDGLTACRRITAAEARLACYDKAVASLQIAVERKDIRVIDKGDVRRARRSLFGFTVPRIGLFGGDPAGEEEFTEINSTVQSVRRIENDRIELRLTDDDAVWATTDPVNFPPKTGAAIRIRKGALGNYFLNIGGSRYRGRRVR